MKYDKLTYVLKVPEQKAMSLLHQIPLLGSQRFHLWLLPQLVQMLLVLQNGHVLYINHALLL